MEEQEECDGEKNLGERMGQIFDRIKKACGIYYTHTIRDQPKAIIKYYIKK